MKKIVLLVAAALLAVLVVAWAASNPRGTMANVLAAVDANDANALRQVTDLPAVQRSLARQYARFLAVKMGNDPDWSSLEQTGYDDKLAQDLVAEAITPEGLLQLLQGNQQVLLGRLNADNVPEEILHTPLAQRTDQEETSSTPFRHTLRLTDKQTHKSTLVLTVGFTGLGWKLTSVQMPMWGKLYPD